MKLKIFAAVVILALAALTFWGNRIIGGMLDAELGPLLTRQLGLPVHLSPMKANLLQLKASSPKLIMGDPQDPAVVATGVEVTLALPALLHGEIRLAGASAADLMVRPSRWPSSNSPPPDNYRFLDQWLPRNLRLRSGQYVNEGGSSYPVSQLHWQRQSDDGATANWTEARQAGAVSVKAHLKSLPALLQLAPVEIDMEVAVAGKPQSQIALTTTVQADKSAAYALQTDIHAAGFSAHVTATGQTPWSLPDQSETRIPLLEPKPIRELINSYGAPDAAGDTATILASALPRLNLPVHRGQVVIDKVRIKDEVTKDNTFKFTSDEHGLQISNLSSKGPSGTLNGALGIISEEQGWTVNLDADLQARDDEDGLAKFFVTSNWLWRTGQTTLDGKGATWESLLNSLHGSISLAGDHRGTVDTPIEINAQLDNHPGEFVLDHLSIKVAEGSASGSASLSGQEQGQRKLTMNLKGAHMDLNFLFFDENAQSLPGVPLPAFLGVLPGIELDVTLDIEGLQAPGLSLAEASGKLQRTERGGRLIVNATGVHYGTLQITLDAQGMADQPGDYQLSAVFDQLDLPEMFEQQTLLHSRSSGNMNFHSRGKSLDEIFTAMHGSTKMTVEIRSDNNWQRTSVDKEKLEFSGDADLVIDKQRILGVQITKLDIDSIGQDLTGDLSVVSGREPWLIADLESEALNVSGLRALLPKSAESADDTGLLSSLKRLGAAQVSLNVDALTLSELTLSDAQIKIASKEDAISVKKLNFTTKNGQFEGQGNITWENEHAKLELSAELSNIDLDQFLIQSSNVKHIPVSGSARILSEGARVEELLGNLTGYIDLQSRQSPTDKSLQSRRKLSMKASRVPNGMHAQINTLQWGKSDLSGSIRYLRTTPPSVEIKLLSGSLSLLPWENEEPKTEPKDADNGKETTLGSVTKASAGFVGKVLRTPLRLMTGRDDTAPGDKLFSNEPLPLDSLKSFNLTFSGQLDSLISTAVSAKDLRFTGTVADGKLALTASSGQLSGGKGEITLDLDSNAVPATFALTSTFNNMRGFTNRNTFPRSGFVSLQSRGQSQAEIAANTSGLIYLELGQGPFDYDNSFLLTDNIASTVFTTLIPGADRKTPQLECGVTVALFKDGKGATPYGFAARTDQANLLGRVEVDLGKEKLQLSFDSRGRHGVGLSMGSIFANTIKVRGSLTDLHIVPKATSLIWRGWAAFMTAGLSVVGESMIKRVLASEDPCDPIKDIIGQELCPENPIAASSKMVCPKT